MRCLKAKKDDAEQQLIALEWISHPAVIPKKFGVTERGNLSLLPTNESGRELSTLFDPYHSRVLFLTFAARHP